MRGAKQAEGNKWEKPYPESSCLRSSQESTGTSRRWDCRCRCWCRGRSQHTLSHICPSDTLPIQNNRLFHSYPVWIHLLYITGTHLLKFLIHDIVFWVHTKWGTTAPFPFTSAEWLMGHRIKIDHVHTLYIFYEINISLLSGALQ